ncbi:ribonuclease HII [Algiphilus sp.]|uniref:ribonuclease HII n=1 Tax=Algiphilus sp. TaxID=1872431 RepID=UPI002A5B7264|nr:ribonuclease HII [Pseudomonadota bacterium]
MKAGVDEAGRGALAGPVVAAAVMLSPDEAIDGLADSKRLSARRRSQLASEIRARALGWAVVEIGADIIDEINILQASFRAMDEALSQLALSPSEVLVDGNVVPQWRWPARAIVGGDGIEPSIMAASILAKVHRDHRMEALDAVHPGYGFAGHKGYPTAAHREALMRLGACAVHRRSYAPVRRCVALRAEAVST